MKLFILILMTLQDTVKVEYHGFAPGGVFEGEPTTSKPLNTTQICEYCRNAERNEKFDYEKNQERYMEFAKQLLLYLRDFMGKNYYWIVFVKPQDSVTRAFVVYQKYWEGLDMFSERPCECKLHVRIWVRRKLDTTLCPREVYEKLKIIQEESRAATTSPKDLMAGIKSRFESNFTNTKIKPGVIIVFKEGALIWSFKHGSCSNYDSYPLVNGDTNNQGVKSFVVAQGWTPRTLPF